MATQFVAVLGAQRRVETLGDHVEYLEGLRDSLSELADQGSVSALDRTDSISRSANRQVAAIISGISP